MEGRRVPQRSVKGRGVVSLPSTRSQRAVTETVLTPPIPSKRESGVVVSPPKTREKSDVVQNTPVSRRQPAQKATVETPRYRETREISETSKNSLMGRQMSPPSTTGPMNTHYDHIPHRVPDRILTESDLR